MASQSKIILGIDPGTAIMGYGFISKKGNKLTIIEAGCIKNGPKTTVQERLVKIAADLKTLIHKHQPDEIAVEELFFSKNVKTAMTVAQARGVILLTAAQAEVVTSEYKPNQIKLAVCGYGAADKKQVQQMVKVILNLKEIIKPDDAADALAVAICHANSTIPLTRLMARAPLSKGSKLRGETKQVSSPL